MALVGEPERCAGVPRRDYELHLSAALRSRRAAVAADIESKAAKFCAFHNAKVGDERVAEAASRGADTSANAPLMPDTKLAVEFVTAIDPPGRRDLLAIDSYLPAKQPGKIEAATFFPADQEKMRAWIEARQGNKNLYVSVNRAKEAAPLNARLNKSDVCIVRAIVADIDASKVLHGDPSGENFHRERDRLLQVVAKSLSTDKECPPTFVVDSGGLRQAHGSVRSKSKTRRQSHQQNAQHKAHDGTSLLLSYSFQRTTLEWDPCDAVLVLLQRVLQSAQTIRGPNSAPG